MFYSKGKGDFTCIFYTVLEQGKVYMTNKTVVIDYAPEAKRMKK